MTNYDKEVKEAWVRWNYEPELRCKRCRYFRIYGKRTVCKHFDGVDLPMRPDDYCSRGRSI